MSPKVVTGIVAFVAAGLLFVACAGTLVVIGLMSADGPTLAGQGQPGTATAAASGQPSNPDRAALVEFVQKRAQDPRGLEVIDLGNPTKEKDGAYKRTFTIRCALIDYTPDTVNVFGAGSEDGIRKVTPKPLSRDSGTVHYTPDGKVRRVHLDGCQKWWN